MECRSSGQPHIPDFPEFRFPLYPRMHLLPTGHVFYSAPSSATLDFDPSSQMWTWLRGRLSRDQTILMESESTARLYFLPLTPQINYSPKVMIMGGDNPATDTTELIDLSRQALNFRDCPDYAPCWVQGPKMAQKRVEMEATILPNGKVLVDGGSAMDEEATTASLKAEIYIQLRTHSRPPDRTYSPGCTTTCSCFCRMARSP